MKDRYQLNQPITDVEDNMLVAFLKVKGFICIPWICRDDPMGVRIKFDVQGDQREKEEAIQAYHGNEPVGVYDYVRMLREVKSAIYDMKKIARTGK